MRIQWLIDNANTTLFNDMCIKRKQITNKQVAIYFSYFILKFLLLNNKKNVQITMNVKCIMSILRLTTKTKY